MFREIDMYEYYMLMASLYSSAIDAKFKFLGAMVVKKVLEKFTKKQKLHVFQIFQQSSELSLPNSRYGQMIKVLQLHWQPFGEQRPKN